MAAKRKRTPKKIVVKVDPLLVKLWSETIKQVKRAKADGAEAYDEYWEAIAEIIHHEPPLYLAGGFSSESAFLEAHVEEPRTTALHHMKVATVATPEDEVKYGTTRILEAINFLEDKNGAPIAAPVDFARLKIPVERDGEQRTVLLEDATVEEVREAIRSLGKKAAESRKASPVELAIEKAVRPAGVKASQVRLSRDVVTLRVKVAALNRVGAALARLRLP